MNLSVQTISSPEFINLQPLDINPLISKVEIKVLYVGENRNRSYISKDVALEMSKTLRGTPIVGYFKEDKQDFADHGEVITIDDEGFHFSCKTTPYGFVAPDAKVWFQEFEDTNELGEKIIREYLMTQGYLWTGQFKECASILEGDGKPHSMELDEETLNGHWAENSKGIEFFIINDAIFSKLCILGEDVEPCFEGSSIAAPNVSASFTKANESSTFRKTLFTMMQELSTALEGGQLMENQIDTPVVEPVVAPVVDAPIVEPEPSVEPQEENIPTEAEPQEAPVNEFEEQYNTLVEEHNALQNNYNELQNKFTEMETSFNAMQTEYNNLVAFKAQIEDAQKDAMINSFTMLSDEDKQDVIANKVNYTVEDIESKLSVICYRKKVSFDINNGANNAQKPAVTFNFNNAADVDSAMPDWVKALENNKKR